MTNKTLAVRLALTLAVLFSIAGVVVYKFSAEIIDRFNRDEQSSLLASIESGPLQLARLNSAELASTYLRRLSVDANAQNPSIVGTEIASGADGKDVYASWTAVKPVGAECLAKISKSIAFSDGMNPYVLRLTIDHCTSREPLNEVTKLCAMVGTLLVLITVAASILAALPVFRSLRLVSAMLDPGKEEEAAQHLLKITYLPLRQLGDKVVENRKLVQEAAVARMTGMLAHDVRKPFSILRMGLGILGNAKDPAGVKKVLSRLIPEIDKAVSSVDGLIADVMEVGSSSTQLIQEPTSPALLIADALGEIFRIYPKANITIEYDLKHAHLVNAHIQKVNRVFSNILGNAVQAMGQKGQMWFKTREIDGMIEFCLGNAGSVIPAESLPKLFDAFFTSGKKGGTGLGLAIAEKVVKAHGGRIWCESSKTQEYPDGKVEFFFTLPAVPEVMDSIATHLPKHSSDVTAAILAASESATGNTTPGSVQQGELDLEAKVIATTKAVGRSLRVLIVDDEDVYRQGLASSLARTPDLTNSMVIRMAADGAQAMDLIQKSSFDLVITDVDMGPASITGFELVQKIKANIGSNSEALLCVHSNRIVAEDHRTAIESGADAFVSKPASREQLLKLVVQAGQRASVARQVATVKATETAKPEILVVDDNVFVLEAWEDILKADAVIHTMANREELEAKLANDPEFLTRLSLVVTDFYFDDSQFDGQDVAKLIKGHRPALVVFLSSDGVFAVDLDGPDRVIGKSPISLSQLRELQA